MYRVPITITLVSVNNMYCSLRVKGTDRVVPMQSFSHPKQYCRHFQTVCPIPEG